MPQSRSCATPKQPDRSGQGGEGDEERQDGADGQRRPDDELQQHGGLPAAEVLERARQQADAISPIMAA